ncbi:hypothetical protein [Comamonas sp. NoAH]|uniref:hypothetical protein n=1 Tax=Comamonas halotolerans TaxID=3041496 RepID=UPI0024E16BF5|nr:hypothetical protein [Comamonas sp. NoAH]
MSHKNSTPDLHPETWSHEFIAAAAALNRLINEQGPEAPFLPENAHLIRAAAKYSPPELQGDVQEWLRQLNFHEASTAMKRIAAEHGEEELAKPEYSDLLFKMMMNAPSKLRDAFEEEAKAMNLLPPTTYVDANGQPVYSLEQISLQLGVSVQELKEQLQSMPDAHELLYTGPVSPLH